MCFQDSCTLQIYYPCMWTLPNTGSEKKKKKKKAKKHCCVLKEEVLLEKKKITVFAIEKVLF